MAKQIILIALAIICISYIPNASSLIAGPGVYYGFELPEPFYNYWNYTVDMKEMKALYDGNDFAGAANIFVNGKYNARNLTAGILRSMSAFTYRNLTGERWYSTYTDFYKSTQYMKDWIDPIMFNNDTNTYTCCGERAAALDVYLRFWQVAYAQHEADAGIRLNIPDEAGHGFAVISSPIEEPHNYWNYASVNNARSCILKVRDPVTGRKFPPTLITYRQTWGDMGTAIAIETPEEKAAAVNEVYSVMEKQVITQFTQVYMVNTKRVLFSGSSPLQKSNCHKSCVKGAHKAAATAAWNAIRPLIAKGDAGAIAAIEAFHAQKDFKLKEWTQLIKDMGTLLASLGMDMKEVYKCL